MKINQDAHLCLEPSCRICHPFRAETSGGVVDNPQTSPQPVDNSVPVVDNSVDVEPDIEPWEGDDEVREAYAPVADKGPFWYALYLEKKLGESRNLIRWFALKYDTNNPVFAYRDPMSGQDLPANQALSKTWFEVVRGGVVCDNCEGIGAVLFETGEPGILRREFCEVCTGLGYHKVAGTPPTKPYGA